MAAEDYFDPYGEPDDYEDGITCRYCGVDELRWEWGWARGKGGRWCLMEGDGTLHCCAHGALAPATADEFPDD